MIEALLLVCTLIAALAVLSSTHQVLALYPLASAGAHPAQRTATSISDLVKQRRSRLKRDVNLYGDGSAFLAGTKKGSGTFFSLFSGVSP